MIDHTGIGVADAVRSAAFYDAAVGALGMRRVVQIPENYYAAFVLDPDGNNIEAVFRER
jgi:catechol 2,3-dioxygenase-like lactoylglutathione lyase family enzyme